MQFPALLACGTRLTATCAVSRTVWARHQPDRVCPNGLLEGRPRPYCTGPQEDTTTLAKGLPKLRMATSARRSPISFAVLQHAPHGLPMCHVAVGTCGVEAGLRLRHQPLRGATGGGLDDTRPGILQPGILAAGDFDETPKLSRRCCAEMLNWAL